MSSRMYHILGLKPLWKHQIYFFLYQYFDKPASVVWEQEFLSDRQHQHQKLARKSDLFLLHPYKPPIFGLTRTQLNGIITSPYPEATLDTFGFPVGAHLSAWRAVFWPWLPKKALFEAKNAVFWTEIHFSETSSKFFVTIMTGHQNDNLFVLTVLQGGLLWGARAYFWSKNTI